MNITKRRNQKTIIIGLVAAFIFVVLGVFVFSYALETLDVKAEELGAQEQSFWTAPFADYTVAGSDSQLIALAVGVAATLLIFTVAFGAAKGLSRKKGETQ